MRDDHITMDGEEAELIDRYEKQFGEVPPVAFIHPDTSKMMIMRALLNNRPFNEKDLESGSDVNLTQQVTDAALATKERDQSARSMRRQSKKR
jgi:hypothetical protein